MYWLKTQAVKREIKIEWMCEWGRWERIAQKSVYSQRTLSSSNSCWKCPLSFKIVTLCVADLSSLCTPSMRMRVSRYTYVRMNASAHAAGAKSGLVLIIVSSFVVKFNWWNYFHLLFSFDEIATRRNGIVRSFFPSLSYSSWQNPSMRKKSCIVVL